MRAFQVDNFADGAQLATIDQPTPAKGEVLLKIDACGLNFADLLMAKGTYQDTPKPPFSLGMEVCGTCHLDKVQTFVHTGMGLSFDSASRSKSPARLRRPRTPSRSSLPSRECPPRRGRPRRPRASPFSRRPYGRRCAVP